MTKVPVAGLVMVSAGAHVLLALGISFWDSLAPSTASARVPPASVRMVPAQVIGPVRTAATATDTTLSMPQSGTAATAAAALGASTPASDIRFFEADEVDVAAEPVPQWDLDPAELAALGLRTLKFAVWANADGALVSCEILSISPAIAIDRTRIAARLCRTAMTPALRRGAKVASIRRIELMLTE